MYRWGLAGCILLAFAAAMFLLPFGQAPVCCER